ncbi:hypothetical protein MMC14_004311 [Varicellaria rhodocarpa]|nr:hypothetical protein [Varicellaria rhodocarpa]
MGRNPVEFLNSKYNVCHLLNIVLLLPPAPAARVLVGRALATLSALSAAAFLRIAVLGPPGGVGDEGRPVLDPMDWGAPVGELDRGDDFSRYTYQPDPLSSYDARYSAQLSMEMKYRIPDT